MNNQDASRQNCPGSYTNEDHLPVVTALPAQASCYIVIKTHLFAKGRHIFICDVFYCHRMGPVLRGDSSKENAFKVFLYEHYI